MQKELSKRAKRIYAAAGKEKAGLVFKNAEYLNVFTNQFMHGDIAVEEGYIVGIGSYEGKEEIDLSGKTVVPGMIDGHIHLESSIVSPAEFARIVSAHGTTAVVTDPHEIANVCGAAGIDYMLQATEGLPVDVFFMVPSCVPSSPFDENGAVIGPDIVKQYMQEKRILGLAEMMNYPGVLAADEAVIQKVDAAMEAGKIVDGHAPGLTGKALQAYITSGVFSDHECTDIKEAKEKFGMGQWIMIREGTASRNLDALLPLFEEPYASRCMLTTDDKHPEDLLSGGHIDYMIRKAIAAGARPEAAYKMASYNAAMYFNLKYRGAVCPGYLADLAVLEDVLEAKVHSVYKRGVRVDRKPIVSPVVSEELKEKVRRTVHMEEVGAADFQGRIVQKSAAAGEGRQAGSTEHKVIGLVPGELLTTDEGSADKICVEKDILKAAVLERHKKTGHIGICYIKGYGLRSGAVATSVAHDSHNIIVIGAREEDMACAVNRIREMGGGMAVAENQKILGELALPVAGLMSDLSAEDASKAMENVRAKAHGLGVPDNIAPFMTLAFVSLPVIPKLKLTSRGVVDVERFCLV